MYILGIDTSCDETSAAVLRDDIVLSNVISSQVELHKVWGGVMPIVAKRAHEERIQPVVETALKKAKVSIKDIDAIAVTKGPGLAIALGVGIEYARKLSAEHGKPLIAVNHMEGHLLSVFTSTVAKPAPKAQYPLLALLVSGNHTEIVLVENEGSYKILGQTLDDASGEAFDKVARMLGLGYPGGALLAKQAEQGNPKGYPFPEPMTKIKNLDFSFSGIKAAMMRQVKAITNDGKVLLTQTQIQDLAASFQAVAIKHLIKRTARAVEQVHPKMFVLGGGVSANLELRKALRMLLKPYGIPLLFPKDKKLCMDNAAMIAMVGYQKAKRKEFVQDQKEVERDPVLQLGEANV